MENFIKNNIITVGAGLASAPGLAFVPGLASAPSLAFAPGLASAPYLAFAQALRLSQVLHLSLHLLLCLPLPYFFTIFWQTQIGADVWANANWGRREACPYRIFITIFGQTRGLTQTHFFHHCWANTNWGRRRGRRKACPYVCLYDSSRLRLMSRSLMVSRLS